MTEVYHAGLKQYVPVPVPDKKPHRVDLWVDAFDGTYRLFLPFESIVELERTATSVRKEGNPHPCSVFELYDRVAKGRYELGGEQIGFPQEGGALQSDFRLVLRLALAGGGHAVVDGERVKVTPKRAAELVETYCTDVPMEDPWRLTFLILSAAISGRDEEPHEVGTRSSTAVYPVSAGKNGTAPIKPPKLRRRAKAVPQ